VEELVKATEKEDCLNAMDSDLNVSKNMALNRKPFDIAEVRSKVSFGILMVQFL